MSTKKQKIAQRVEALGIGKFDGSKQDGKYIIGIVSFQNLKEIEAYIDLYAGITAKIKPALDSARAAYEG